MSQLYLNNFCFDHTLMSIWRLVFLVLILKKNNFFALISFFSCHLFGFIQAGWARCCTFEKIHAESRYKQNIQGMSERHQSLLKHMIIWAKLRPVISITIEIHLANSVIYSSTVFPGRVAFSFPCPLLPKKASVHVSTDCCSVRLAEERMKHGRMGLNQHLSPNATGCRHYFSSKMQQESH